MVHCTHGFAFALSACAMILLVIALPVSWFSAHAEPSKTKAIAPYAHPVDVEQSLWHMSTHHRREGFHCTRTSWQDQLVSTSAKRNAPYCPMMAGKSPTNVVAHNEVALTSGLAILACILCQAYIVLGVLYSTGRVPTRIAFLVVGSLAAMSAFGAVAMWMHFAQLCGEFTCPHAVTATDDEMRTEDYEYQCGLGLGVRFEMAAPILVLISMILFAVKAPGSSVPYAPLKTTA